MPVSDCAPVIYAWESGLFAKYELDVELQRVASWTSIRDGVIYGNLDAAHAPATLPFISNLGVDSDPCACVSALILSLQGTAIVVSNKLWDEGVRSAATLKEQIHRRWRQRTYTLAVISRFSPQDLLLRQWLKSAQITPEVDVRIVAMPPEQMYPTLKLGYIDGYCASEPWATIAIQAGLAVCLATSRELAPLHPEKVLMVRQSFAAGRPDEHERLLAALLEACAECDLARNRRLLSQVLAHRQYVNAPADALLAGFVGDLESGVEAKAAELIIFHQNEANDPTDNKAGWLMRHLYDALGQDLAKFSSPGRSPVLKNVLRRDLFVRAKGLIGQRSHTEAEPTPMPTPVYGTIISQTA